MNECRFRDLPGHVCARRDGRPIHPSEDLECHLEARAQVSDEAALAIAVDAVTQPLLAELLENRAAWA